MPKKKQWNRNQRLILIGTIMLPILFFCLQPAREDIYRFVKDKSYLALRDKYHYLLKVVSDKTSILTVRPLFLLPYYPENPEATGQRKAVIVSEINIRNRRLANNIIMKFDIDDGAGRRVDSAQWDYMAKQQSLIFSMFYPDIRFIIWTPDIPNGIEAIAKNRSKPFKLWLTVKWEDIDKKAHELGSYSELRYNKKDGLLYFEEISNNMKY